MTGSIQTFEYERPEAPRNKVGVKLAKTDFLRAAVQYIGPEGANNLHAHTGNDGFWLVLSGRARFYGEGDEPVAELGAQQGVLVPHGTPYWFESASDEPLEILHVAARTSAKHDKRIDFTERIRRGGAQEPRDQEDAGR